jgi:hypothetical protein
MAFIPTAEAAVNWQNCHLQHRMEPPKTYALFRGSWEWREPPCRFGHALILAVCISGLGCTTSLAQESSESAPLKKVADVSLPGPAVRFDYQSIDPSQGRLYIAHMNADQLLVFDVKKR